MNSRPLDRSNRLNQVSSLCLALLVALLPKCPLCWAAYGSLFSALGIAHLPDYDWISPVLATLLVANLLMFGIRVKRGKLCGPFILSAAGSITVIAGRLGNGHASIACIGVALIALSSLWSFASKTSRGDSLRSLPAVRFQA